MFRRKREEFGDSHLEHGPAAPAGGRSGAGSASITPFLLEALRAKRLAPATEVMPVTVRDPVIQKHVELRAQCQATLQELHAEVARWRATVEHAATGLEAARRVSQSDHVGD